MKFRRWKKNADNGASTLPDDHGQESRREPGGERHRRPSRIDGLRNGLASTMRTFRTEPTAPPRGGMYAPLGDDAYHGKPEDFAGNSEQPNGQRRVEKPLSILRNRRGRGRHERYEKPYEHQQADREWIREARIAYTPDGSVYSSGSEFGFEDQNRRIHGQTNVDPGWTRDGLDEEPASWAEGSHTANAVNTRYDLPEEDCSFGSDQPIMATRWNAQEGRYTAGSVNTDHDHAGEDSSSSSSSFSQPTRATGRNEGDPHDEAEYSVSDTQSDSSDDSAHESPHAQAVHPPEAEHHEHNEEANHAATGTSQTSHYDDDFISYLHMLHARRGQQYGYTSRW